MTDPYYGSAAWKQLRAQVLKRDRLCQVAGCGKLAVAVDHIIPRSRGGPDALANLRGLCIACHNARARGGEPRLRGCYADGTPRDRGHWWNT